MTRHSTCNNMLRNIYNMKQKSASTELSFQRTLLTWTSPCRLFGTKCAKCGNGFSKNDFVMRARNKIFHIDCFRCVACSRQLIPGDEFALRDDGLFCKADHEVVERATNTPNGSKSENSDSGVGSPSNNNNNESKPNLHASGKKNFHFYFGQNNYLVFLVSSLVSTPSFPVEVL